MNYSDEIIDFYTILKSNVLNKKLQKPLINNMFKLYSSIVQLTKYTVLSINYTNNLNSELNKKLLCSYIM